MSEVVVMFGSSTDAGVYEPLMTQLRNRGVDATLRIASAHKTPDLVEEILKGDFKIAIAGAGLAAHLPGVIASKTLTPVIGVPCGGAFDGLDAFLAIVQMPPGVPVLGVGPNETQAAAKAADLMLRSPKNVSVIGEGKRADTARATLNELGIRAIGSEISSDGVNIALTPLGENIPDHDELCIYCPIASGTKAADAVNMMSAAKSGIWVGVNRAENAAIAAAQIVGREEVADYRKKIGEKVKKDDEALRA